MDLIDRQAAIDALKEHEDYKGYLRGDFEEILEALPSAQPRKGKWLLLDGYRCSECNHKLQTTGLPSSCPNCGADLRGEQDD